MCTCIHVCVCVWCLDIHMYTWVGISYRYLHYIIYMWWYIYIYIQLYINKSYRVAALSPQCCHVRYAVLLRRVHVIIYELMHIYGMFVCVCILARGLLHVQMNICVYMICRCVGALPAHGCHTPYILLSRCVYKHIYTRQCVVACGSVWQCVAMCCSVLQCVAVGCSVLQYAAPAHWCL